jgi:hypothetical protein
LDNPEWKILPADDSWVVSYLKTTTWIHHVTYMCIGSILVEKGENPKKLGDFFAQFSMGEGARPGDSPGGVLIFKVRGAELGGGTLPPHHT